MNRFFVSPEDIIGDRVQIPNDIAAQIRKVLRLREGEPAQFLDNAGWCYECEIEYPNGKDPSARVLEKHPAEGESNCDVSLYLGLTQREKFEWILQKCTEAGVSRIIPMVTERTLVRKSADTGGKQERWEKILKEAAEQCGRARIPELLPAVNFRDAVEDGAKADLKLFFWEEEKHNTLRALIDPLRGQVRSVSLMVGPEGGFPVHEAESARQTGWQTCTLGKRIYRVETAAMAAVILTLYELEREEEESR